MAVPNDFIRALEPVPTQDLLSELVEKNQPQWPHAHTFELRNELRPADLFCYLGARFGPPNGVQNLFRADDSDNLIHWEWTLQCRQNRVTFQGHNFRTEIHLHGEIAWEPGDKEILVSQIRGHFGAHGPGMGKIREGLETWIEFVNPYQRIRRAVDKLLAELDEMGLDLNPASAQAHFGVIDFADSSSVEQSKAQWADIGSRYSKGFGLCFGVRSMLPVLAEAFANLLTYILMKPELKADQRLRENAFRQPIDIRIKSLAINCNGFARHPDYSVNVCKKYHSLVNERNDLLHGNVAIEKLKFNEVHFMGKVPVFREYRSMWERALGVEMEAVGLMNIRGELKIVDDLVKYLLSCVDEQLREQVAVLTERYELGLNAKSGRLGVLFPEWLVDFHVAHQRGG